MAKQQGTGPSDGPPRLNILIADDHPIICLALGEMLKTEFGRRIDAIEEVADGDSLLVRLQAGCFDHLVLDMRMPGRCKGIVLLEKVMQQQPDLRVIVYTGVTHPFLAVAALDLGVKAYVLKSSGPQMAIDACKAVVAGETFIDPSIDLAAARQHPWNSLTPGERAVVIALARGEHLQAIAIDSERSYKTITTHKYNALRKLGLRSKSELGAYLANNGLDYLLEAASC